MILESNDIVFKFDFDWNFQVFTIIMAVYMGKIWIF